MGESGVVTNLPILSPHAGGHPALQGRGAAFGAGVQDPHAAPAAKSPVEGMFSPVIGPGVFATAGPRHALALEISWQLCRRQRGLSAGLHLPLCPHPSPSPCGVPFIQSSVSER